MRFCLECKQTLSFNEFYYRYSNKGKVKRYYYDQCRICYNKNRFTDAYKKGYRQYELRRKYGLTEEGVVKLLMSQGHICPICECDLEINQACVDHDHISGKVRGLLHKECNSAIGLLGDNPDWLDNGSRYLRR